MASCSDDSPSRVSKLNIDHLLESFLSVPDSASIDASFDRLLESKSIDSDQNDFIQRTIHLSSVLLEAGKRSVRKRFSIHNALVWRLPPDLTIKVFSMMDTQSVCIVAATCLFFQKCAMDPLCFANIHLPALVPNLNDHTISTMIQRAGNALRSVKLGVPPPCPADESGFSSNDRRVRDKNESAILTWSCLSSLSGNDGAPGSRLRRLHLYNVHKMIYVTPFASLSACPSLVDLEIVGLLVSLEHSFKSLTKHWPLLERLILDSSSKGSGCKLQNSTCHQFVLNCPNMTTLFLKGFGMDDNNAHILVKGFHMLKCVDFSRTCWFTGSFLKKIGTNGGGKHLEVIILRNSGKLKQVELKQFMEALLTGDLRLLRHLDISLSCFEDDNYDDDDDDSFIQTNALLAKKLLNKGLISVC